MTIVEAVISEEKRGIQNIFSFHKKRIATMRLGFFDDVSGVAQMN